MNHQSLSINRNSPKTQFALLFIRSLARIKMATPPRVSSIKTLKQCSRKIKLAADTSMATTVGSRRSWSRAMLLKHKNQARNRFLVKQKVVGNNKKKIMKINKEKEKKKIKNTSDKAAGQELSRADKLRQLVPGGEAMDFCSLLEETAHYIKCLNTQVQVMQKIADIYTS